MARMSAKLKRAIAKVRETYPNAAEVQRVDFDRKPIGPLTLVVPATATTPSVLVWTDPDWVKP